MGAILGACAAVFVTRVREEAEREDEQSLYNRMDERIRELEARTLELREGRKKASPSEKTPKGK